MPNNQRRNTAERSRAAFAWRHNRHQITDLSIYSRGVGDGFPDLSPERLAIFLAQSMDGHFERALRHAELSGRNGAVTTRGIADQERLHQIEIGGRVAAPQPL